MVEFHNKIGHCSLHESCVNKTCGHQENPDMQVVYHKNYLFMIPIRTKYFNELIDAIEYSGDRQERLHNRSWIVKHSIRFKQALIKDLKLIGNKLCTVFID